MRTPEIPPPPRVPRSFGPDTRARWITITLALIGVAGTPTCATVVQAWRAPEPPPPVVTAIEWDAMTRKVDRLVTLAEAEQRLRSDQIDALRKTDDRLADAIERLDGRPTGHRTPRTR